jgi:hypothetical protein
MNEFSKENEAMPEERSEPRISVNKLGEYLVASPVRRRRIVADQKRPSGFIVTRYREAAEAMISFLQSGATEDPIIERAIEDLLKKPVSSDFQEQDRDLSIEALVSFLDMADAIELNELQCHRGEAEPPHLVIAGVTVSVRPEIILTGQNRAGEKVTGLIKIYLGKSYPLTEEAGSYIGTVLLQYGSQFLATLETIDYRLCQTLDVFAKTIHTAPRSFRRRQNDIEAACQEIARAWSFV